jgi:hypothetical protein
LVAAAAVILRSMLRPVSPIPQIPIPRLPRRIDQRCREEERIRVVQWVQEVQEVQEVQRVHAADARVVAADVAARPVRRSSRSR